MFNVTVVNIKDITKYLVSITITLCLVMFVARYFSHLSEDKKQQLEIDRKISQIMQTSLLICLDETIPGIKETNRELNMSYEEQINESDILGNLLKIELGMFEEETKMADIQNTASNQVQNPETNIQESQNQEKQNIEVARKHYDTSCNSKSSIR